MKLADARIVLTGGTGGLGAAIARMLAGAGAAMLLADRNAQRLAALAAELRALGGRVAFLAGDLGDRADRARLSELAASWLGGVNVLINNAGLNDFAWLGDQDEARIEAMLRVNLLAPVLLTRALLPHLDSLPEAHVVNIGSSFGSIGYPGYAPYSASKFGLRGFTEAMRREMSDSTVRFHYVAPRACRTALNSPAACALNDALGVAMDPPEVAARAVLRVLEHGGDEAYLGWPEKLFVRINAVLPRLVDASLNKQLQIIKQYAATPDVPTSG
jgi:short-subunit dehydrogenase